MQVQTIKPGNGQKPQPGNTVTIHYVGSFATGQLFDSSRQRGQPFEFQVGAGKVIKGLDQGVLNMSVGETAKLTLPPELAYGKQGAGNVIPPDTTLNFEVELLSVK